MLLVVATPNYPSSSEKSPYFLVVQGASASKLAIDHSKYGWGYPPMQSILLTTLRSMHEAGILEFRTDRR